MPRKCEITDKKIMFGNNVSHSHRKTRRTWKPNIQKKKIFDEVTGKWITLKISARAIRTINKKGLHQVLKDINKKK